MARTRNYDNLQTCNLLFSANFPKYSQMPESEFLAFIDLSPHSYYMRIESLDFSDSLPFPFFPLRKKNSIWLIEMGLDAHHRISIGLNEEKVIKNICTQAVKSKLLFVRSSNISICTLFIQ